MKQFKKRSRSKEAGLILSVILSFWLPCHLAFARVSHFAKNQNVPKRHKLDPREPRKLVLKSRIFVKPPFCVFVSPFRESLQFLFFKKRKNDSGVMTGLQELEIYGGKKTTSIVQLIIKW